jgi:tRNA threonylcarbamoyladenosine biosynthesis protein TsaB
MKILGIDSSTPVTTIALIENQNLVVETVLNTRRNHSKKLMPVIDMVLKEAEVTITEIDGIAVAKGPGSFTGLRIGLTTAKTIAWSLGKPLLAIPSLDGLALNAQGVSGIICPILNARKNEVYTCLYKIDKSNNLHKLSDYLAIEPLKLIDILKSKDEAIILLGDGVEEFATLFTDALGDKITILTPVNWLSRASHIAYLGLKKLQNNEQDDVMHVSPLYIRKSEAELRLKQKKRGSLCE